MPVALAPDVARVTFPLPTKPGHVHGYLLRDEDGWTLVDTGLALPDAEERLAAELAALDGPVTRILVTHMHPDHVGGSEQAAAATGARVLQGELDRAQCVHVWGNAEWPSRIADWFLAHGVPAEICDDLVEQGALYAPFIRYAPETDPVGEGDEVAGWRVVWLPGHADGHLALVRDGALVAGDHLLPGISPSVGLYPDSRPDPLGDYLASLRRTAELGLHVAYPGHGEPLDDPAGRVRELVAHHDERLAAAERALGDRPLSGYEVSRALFGSDLSMAARRFAVAETLSHLVRLEVDGRAVRVDDGVTRWRAA